MGTISAQGFVLGIKSHDNTWDNIHRLHTYYLTGETLPLYSFFFDTWDDVSEATIQQAMDGLPQGTVFHISLTPRTHTARQIMAGSFDAQYLRFFRWVKERPTLHVMFRTMHEMNGGRYPWGSDPHSFRRAWHRMRLLAQHVGLTSSQIQFVFSFNHRDAPTNDETPSKASPLFFCDLLTKQRTGCFTFEDYYPGSTLVDIVGLSFYNRGKAAYDRQWLSAQQILTNPRWNTLTRALSFGKPLIFDEVGTSAVWYRSSFNAQLSRHVFLTEYKRKNERLYDRARRTSQQSGVLGAIYFNADFTQGLSTAISGEADRAVINVDTGKRYHAFDDILTRTNNADDRERLARLFGKHAIFLQGKWWIVTRQEFGMLAALQKKMTDRQSWGGLYRDDLPPLIKRFLLEHHVLK
ncbi:MAG: hypothetical protein NZL83_02310 [Candidatus Absconditabacterales bacterium]|nr:hypothetical protein [Candidatus Absconditabacterales bacterium]